MQTSLKKKLVSVVVPAFNEEECINELYSRLSNVFEREKNYDFEIVLVENGSTDSTFEIAKAIASQDARLKILRLSRNFRMDGGLTAGLSFVKGDACVLMASDLQDPPELISEFLRLWEIGWENVYGVIQKRRGTGPIRAINSKLFYIIAGKLTDGKIPQNVSDFRLVDRKVYKNIQLMDERNRFIRGLFAWVGFKSIGIPMERPERFGGTSKAYSFGVLDLALKGIFAHSYKPLKLISGLGIIMSGLTLVSIPPLIFSWIYKGVPFAGFGTITALLLVFFSIISLFLGILAEYIALIYEEVKARPNFLVSEKVNFEDFDA